MGRVNPIRSAGTARPVAAARTTQTTWMTSPGTAKE